MTEDDFLLQATIAAMKVELHDAETRADIGLTQLQFDGIAQRAVQMAETLKAEIERKRLVVWSPP